MPAHLQKETEREVWVTFLKNFSKLIVIKHSKLGPKCDRKKHNSVISSIIHKQIQLFTFVQGKTGNKLNFYRSKPHKSLHVEKSNFWHMDSICEYVFKNKKKNHCGGNSHWLSWHQHLLSSGSRQNTVPSRVNPILNPSCNETRHH